MIEKIKKETTEALQALVCQLIDELQAEYSNDLVYGHRRCGTCAHWTETKGSTLISTGERCGVCEVLLIDMIVCGPDGHDGCPFDQDDRISVPENFGCKHWAAADAAKKAEAMPEWKKVGFQIKRPEGDDPYEAVPGIEDTGQHA